MNDCSNPQAPNTTVPHLLPYILLRDRKIEDILGLLWSMILQNEVIFKLTAFRPYTTSINAGHLMFNTMGD